MAFRALLERSRQFDSAETKLNSVSQPQRAAASMQPLPPVFQRLELSAYTPVFQENGFDMWEDVLDITENDLEQLNVLRGHRRRLQREIANYKGVPIEQVIQSPGRATSLEAGDNTTSNNRPEGPQSTTGKRRYRRHPKPDANAPERPPSAYVLFSNKIRDELKSENLSFTEMAKVVGEKWQQLDTDGREPFESEANDLKDTYNAKMTEYKKTDDWKEYQEYLANFKAAQQAAASQQGPEGKRLKLERSADNSYGSSRGSQGTPTTSTQNSPINTTQTLINGGLVDGASGSHSLGGHGAYATGFAAQSSASRPAAVPTSRPPVVGQGLEQNPGPYQPQQQLPPIATDRPLPRRSQNQPPSLLGRAPDAASSQMSSTSSTYSPHTPVEAGQRSTSATSAELTTPYAQHHGLKNLNLAGRDSPVYSHTSASPVHPPYPGPDPSSRTLPPLPQQPPPQRMDGLDALALASRILDSNQDTRNVRGPPG